MQRYANWYRDTEGRGIYGATVTVFNAGTANVAQLYDWGGSQTGPSPIGNPITTDPNGFFAFAVPNGVYDIQIQGGSMPTTVIPNLTISEVFSSTTTYLNPMTTLGDTFYGGASGVPTRLSGNATTTPKYLRFVGNGSAALAPTVAQIPASEVANTPSGTVTSTDVQSAINQVNGFVNTNDGLALHKAGSETVTGVKAFSAQPTGIAASSIVVTPSGTIASTDVASALQEIVSDSVVATQQQTYSAFVTAGTAPAFTLTPSPAVTSYTEPLELEVKFNAAGTIGSNTLNVSGLGALNLKQYGPTGTKVPAVVASGQVAKVRYDGTDLVILNPLPMDGAVRGSFRNLVASSSGADYGYTLTADEISLQDANGFRTSITSWSVTGLLSASGANGLDTGSVAVSTWYYVWAIYNSGTSTKAMLFSLSSSSPTLPSGYTQFALVGAVRTNAGTAYPLAQYQRGNSVQYRIGTGNVAGAPTIISGNYANVGATITGVVPTAIARKIKMVLFQAGAAAYCGMNSVAIANTALAGSNMSSNGFYWYCEGVIESTNVYYTGGASCSLLCYGWEF